MHDIYRRFPVRLWTETFFRALSTPEPSARYLFLYLLGGPHTILIPGLFTANREGMASSLRWPLQGFDGAWNELLGASSEDPKRQGLVEADWEAGVVWIPLALEHNEPSNPNQVKAWTRSLRTIPDCELKVRATRHFVAYLKTRGKDFLEAFEDGCVNRFRNQEQEQERTQKRGSREARETSSQPTRGSQKRPRPVRKGLENPTHSAREALIAAVKRTSSEFAHPAIPEASTAQWRLGAAKVEDLVNSGMDLRHAAEAVARSALGRLAEGLSTSFGFALHDCVVGRAERKQSWARAPRASRSVATTHEDFADAEPLLEQLKKFEE